jgi:hypothetical protein
MGNAIVRGAGLGPLAAADSFNSNNWDDEVDEFIEFGFTVLPGFTVDLTNLIIGTRSSATGPGTIGLFTSLDGFAAAVHTIVQPSESFISSTLDLTSLPTLGPGTFSVRLIEIGDTAANGSGPTQGVGTFRLFEPPSGQTTIDVHFNGDFGGAAVPEASAITVWLTLLVGACLGWTQRRRWL